MPFQRAIYTIISAFWHSASFKNGFIFHFLIPMIAPRNLPPRNKQGLGYVDQSIVSTVSSSSSSIWILYLPSLGIPTISYDEPSLSSSCVVIRFLLKITEPNLSTKGLITDNPLNKVFSIGCCAEDWSRILLRSGHSVELYNCVLNQRSSV